MLRTTTVHIVLYVYETRSLILIEDADLKVSGKKLLRKAERPTK